MEAIKKREFRRGSEAMRGRILTIFAMVSGAEFNGRAIAELVRTCEAPTST